jgi:chemosensory pili system protein ChpA (sensor histidine kinase/response regulator)
MASFSIDDVRDTLQGDITQLLSRIEESARVLARLPELPTSEEGPSFHAVGDQGHAIYGTSALVGAESLATSARCLEKLAGLGQEEVRLAAAHLANARRLADAAALGVNDMRQMLEHELAGRSEEAEWCAIEWQTRADDAIKGDLGRADPRDEETPAFAFTDVAEAAAVGAAKPEPAAAEPAAKGDEGDFDFEDAPAAGEDELRRELLQVFEQEARETVVALQGHFAALAAEPTSPSHLAPIERLFHTLKGAAATIGLGEIREDAGELQHRVEAMLESSAPMARESLEALVADANRMLARAKLPAITLGGGEAARPSGPAGETRASFDKEARALTGEIADLIDALASAMNGQRGATLDRIGAALHRLRGSALVVGEEAAAEEASRLEASCADGAATTAALTKGLARIVAALRIAPKRATPEETAAMREARAVFFEEARHIHADAAALAKDLAADGSAMADGTLAELAALLHRLKGSAAVVAHDGVASEAAALHALASNGAAHSSVGAIKEGLARIAAMVGAEAASSSIAHERHEPSAKPVRESVTVPAEPELWRAFTLECNDLLDALERETLDLEHSDTPKERVRALLRHYHTLKGVVNTMGLGPTGAVLHRAEDFLEEVIERPVLPSLRGIVSLLLQVQMDVRKNLRQAQHGYVETSLAAVDARATRLLGGSVVEDRSSRAPHSEASMHSQDSRSANDAASHGSVADGADRRFIKVATERLDVLMNLAGELVVSRSRLLSKVGMLRSLQSELGRGSKRLVETIDAFRRENEFANLDGRKSGQGAQRAADVPPPPAILRKTDDVAQPAAWSGFSDLELDRYDDVHVLSRSLAEITSDFQELYNQFQRGVATLTDDSDAFGGIISGIQNEVTRARMVPLEFLFARLRLPVRDAATREGKEVRVMTRGEDVSIDKTIADALFQPMLHLVRNAVAHGVEKSSAREAKGKNAAGTITLAARQESGQILLEVRDDGAGLDLEALRERGVQMGLISAEVPASDPSIKELIFAPQLSTQKDAGAVAGRGVGCDVVRRSVERLNGTIRVESERGRGTVFTVTLPLTLAITKALLVRHRQQVFALPLYFAERIIDAQEQRVVDSAGHRRIKLEDTFVPVRALGDVLLGDGHGSDDGPVVVLRVGDQRLTLQVDQVLGQEEIVVKNLGSLLAGHPLFAGVSIRGTGELVLIVDVPELVDARGSGMRVATPAAPKARSTRESRESHDSVAGESAAEPPRADSSSSEPTRTRLRVLFVDDSLSVRKVAEMNLRALGVDVTLAVDGLDAMSKLREQTFDLVFTDLEMPRMHGYELIRELRFLPAYADLPILVVTSRSGQKHQEQAKALGATEYMTKPFTPQSLESALKRWGKIRSGKGGSQGDAT